MPSHAKKARTGLETIVITLMAPQLLSAGQCKVTQSFNSYDCVLSQ